MVQTSDHQSVLRSAFRDPRSDLDPTILRAAHADLARVLDATICFFGLYDAASQTVEVIWQIHDGVELDGGQFPLGNGPTSRAIRECQPQLIRRWSEQGPRVQVQYATERPGLPESSITVPLLRNDAVLGILALQSYQPEAYDEQDITLVQNVADQLASRIAAAQRTAEPDLAHVTAPLLVLDGQARLVRLNHTARQLLTASDGSVIFGQPVSFANSR